MNREEAIVAALQKAGEEILKYDPKNVETSTKSNEGDLLTAADLASEKVIIETIKTAFPDDIVVSEETVESHDALTDENLTAWVIDPIDGTNNFKHNMAYSGISIGYIENGKPVVGGIYDPYRGKLYIAKLGEGATCNGQPIRVSNQTELTAGARVCTSNSSAPGGTKANLDRFNALDDVWVDVLGSAVLIMADVASGKLDLYHHNGLKPWDNAAAFLIAQEAGAKIVDLKGNETSWLSNEVVAGNPEIVDQFITKTVR